MARPNQLPRATPTFSVTDGRLTAHWRRGLALGTGTVLIGSYLGVFYEVANVAGGVEWLAVGVGAAGALATLTAGVSSTRHGVVVGSVLLVAGIVGYVALVPEVRTGLLSVAFVRRWLTYLTGHSVLDFWRVDIWAAAVAPGPTYLAWLLLLRRRYGAAALVGGVMLLFFTLTGDAGPTVTLLGWTSLLGLLGAGLIEEEEGGFERILEVGFVLALGAIVARQVDVATAASRSTEAGTAPAETTVTRSAERGFHSADPSAHIHETISVSPAVLFTIEADEAAYWHVSAYDRYTGRDWIRTGGHRPYTGPLESGTGDARRLAQTVTTVRRVRALPTAWKPVDIRGLARDRVRVTDQGGVVPTDTIEAAAAYRVTSERPTADPDRLRAADTGYPVSVLERYGQLPADTPDRIRGLAMAVTADSPSLYDSVVAIQRWLQANKSYDLRVDRPTGEVVEAFLFSMDAGYCINFASAMAVLLRSVGIPTRFVLGYTAGQRVGERRWVVRGFDSHAWVQVYVPGQGWVPFDPTPSAGRTLARRALLEAARDEAVAGIDTAGSRGRPLEHPGVTTATPSPGTERVTADTARAGDEPTPEGMGVGPAADPASSVDGDPVRALDGLLADRDRISVLASGVAAAIGIHWLRVIPRGSELLQLRWQRPTESPARDVERAYRRLEIDLKRRYRPRAEAETPRQYVERVGGRADAGRRRRVLELYESARYRGDVTRAEADEAIRIVDEVIRRS